MSAPGSLPSFERDAASPRLPEGPGVGSAIVLALDGDRTRAGTVARGAYRVAAGDRALLGRAPLRAQVWLVAIHRDTRATWLGRLGSAAVVFSGEEPETGGVDGWFSVNLAECCGLPETARGIFDVTAVLGPFKSAAVEIQVRG